MSDAFVLFVLLSLVVVIQALTLYALADVVKLLYSILEALKVKS